MEEIILRKTINNEIDDNYKYKKRIEEYLVKINGEIHIPAKDLYMIMNILKATNEFTWETLCEHLNSAEKWKNKILGFYAALNREMYNFGKHNQYIKENEWLLEAINFSENTHFVGSNPENIYILTTGTKRNKLYIDTSNKQIRRIVKSFLDDLSKRKSVDNGIRNFLLEFEKSLDSIKLDNLNIESFNEKTFENQFKYYEKRNNSTLLKQFYQYIILVRKEDIFSLNSGLNKNFLDKENFRRLYSDGFRVVYLNKMDDVPKIDKWVLSPNGHEKYTTTMKATDFLILDFSRVESSKIREYLKRWAFYETKSLKSLKNSLNNLFLYFEFIQEVQKKSGNVIMMNNLTYTDALIKKSEIQIFLKHVKEKGYEQHTLNAYSSSLARFVNYLLKVDERLDPEILAFLTVKKPKKLKGKVIEKDDYKKIFDVLKKDINEKLFERLRYIFMYLLGTTNFRPNEILHLKRNCIVEGMKTGDVKIICEKEDIESDIPTLKLKRKMSGGIIEEVNPSQRTIELIKIAIQTTNELMMEADKELKDYIFLEEKVKLRGKVEAIKADKMYRSLKSILEECNIEKDYTLYDFRHTYMTELYNNCDIMTAFMASGHKQFTTTDRYYIHPDIRCYLEAVHKINIGDVKLNGKVIEILDKKDIKKDIKAITVKDGCGYCNGSCSDNDRIDCLICKSFIVTVDRAPYLKEKIKQMDYLIEAEDIIHEKEHLVSIKKLYLGYLAQIYTMKKEKE